MSDLLFVFALFIVCVSLVFIGITVATRYGYKDIEKDLDDGWKIVKLTDGSIGYNKVY